MRGYFLRAARLQVEEYLLDFPAVAVLGPRQCGKTTLAKMLVENRPSAVYLDLERPSDRRKLESPELYIRTQRNKRRDPLFCLDEIQLVPELFPVLRSLIDESGRNGQFLILGSASHDLIRQTSESLAGRIAFLELTPLLASEVEACDLASLGVSHTTVRSYLELLSQTFMVRLLEPLEPNIKKRLVKSPKVYLRDSGILHTLLEIEDTDGLLGHPIYGSSWEGLILDNVIASFSDWRPSFYRTSYGAEIDLVLSRGPRRIAIECKASAAPTASRGLYNALDDLGLPEAWILAPVEETYPLDEGVRVVPLHEFLQRVA